MPDTRTAARHEFTSDELDDVHDSRPVETDFGRLAGKVLSRRGFLSGSAAFAASAFVMSTGVLKPLSALAGISRFGFEAVAANGLDTVTVPKGYGWHVVAKWGNPLWSRSMEFDPKARGSGASQELAFGDNNDGMALFNHRGRNVLAVNNEFVNLGVIFGGEGSGKPQNADDVRRGKAGHGVSVLEIARKDGKWSVVKDSPYNRRITPDTPMDITGPALGHDLVETAADPAGGRSLGTWNNCGNGRTPWGTYLACEENFHGYFSSSDPGIEVGPEFKRYGVGTRDRGYAWATTDEWFDIARHPHEPNRAGYIVEIDPLDPKSPPKKRTALGRGEWLELTPESTGMASMAEACVHTRIAASAVKATTMDRPEWVAANPRKAEVYCTLTNNKNRGKKPNKGGDATPVGGPNPRAANLYGQIVRWRPDGGNHLATGFAWDLYVVAGNPTVHGDANAGSKNITPDNMFNSPDGIAFDRNGMLWIQTDGQYSNTKGFAGQGNNQMLVDDPVTGEIRRFLVGPRQCEVTGIA